ncbi:MAG: LysR family transcriptional regulator [Pseudomonadota bacterium]
MDDLRAIRAFLAVTELGGFAAAGRVLGITPASVTRAVAALEADLGVQLLVRTTRQVSLTSAGAAYAARVAPLVVSFDAAKQEVQCTSDRPSGRLRLTAPMSFGSRVLPRILSDYIGAHEDVSVSTTLTDTFVDIMEGTYDLAIRISEPPSDKSTIWRKICHVERVVVTGAGSPWAGARSPEEIDEAACYAFDAGGTSESWDLTSGGRTRRIRAGSRLGANNGDLLAGMLGSDGIAVLPRFIVESGLRRGELVTILEAWNVPDIWLTLYYPPYDRLPPLVAHFSDFFEEHILKVRPFPELSTRGSNA